MAAGSGTRESRDLATENEELRARLQRLEQRLGPDPDAAPASPTGFPKAVYREQEEPNPAQLDHPGWDSKTVGDQGALDAALKAGWALTHGPFVYPTPAKK